MKGMEEDDKTNSWKVFEISPFIVERLFNYKDNHPWWKLQVLNNFHYFSYLRHWASSQWHRYLTLDKHTTICWSCSQSCMFAELGHNWVCPVAFAQSPTSTQSEHKKGIKIKGIENKQFAPSHLQFVGPRVSGHTGQMSSWVFTSL